MHHIKYQVSERMGFQSLNLLKRRLKFLALLVAFGLIFNAVPRYSPRLEPPVGGREEVFWNIEAKLRNVHENIDHRFDFVRAHFKRLSNQTKTSVLSSLEQRHNFLFAKTELLFQFNRFKDFKLKSIAKSINDKIDRLQDGKCHLDKVVACFMIQNCGYACQFHQLTICGIMAYYMERTMVIVRPEIPGMENFGKIFHPVTTSCAFNNHDANHIAKNTFRPLKLVQQEENGASAYIKFLADLKELSKYHSQPVAFLIGHLMRKALSFNEDSDFFRAIKNAKHNFNITGPYVGIHVRLSDKYHEAVLFSLDHYMHQVDKFYAQYFIKHPDQANSTVKTVYVASDERRTFQMLKDEKYKGYKFIYNDTYSFLTDSQDTRYSTGGFESLLFDIYFLSHADYLICTFSSNICRLAYELSIPDSDDKSKTAHSLDTPYYVLSDAVFHKMAVLDRKKEPKLRRGQVVARRVVHGMKYDEYNQDGFFLAGRTSKSETPRTYPSYLFRNFYY